jgi:hypothetical protein
MIYTWRLRTLLLVPKYRGETPPVGGTLEFYSRLPEQARQYDDITVAVQKPANENTLYNTQFGQLEQIELVADVPTLTSGQDSYHGAIERFSPVFETLIDLMAFDMAAVPAVGQLEIIDVTPPVAVGDERTEVSFTAPPYDRYIRAVEMLAIRGRLIGELPEAVDTFDSKTAAVLRWFVKALSTDLLHDQFIFLWVALEILCDACDVRVEQPYVGPCQHEIPECPECGRPTTRMVRGATIKAYLQRYGVTMQQANQLWQMRQLMHGAIPFDSKKLQNLGTLVQPLRAVVAAGLKSKLGKANDDPPIVAAEGFIVHPAMALSGTRQINENDIHPLIP